MFPASYHALTVAAAAGLAFDGDLGVADGDHAKQQTRRSRPPIAAPSGMKVKNTSMLL